MKEKALIVLSLCLSVAGVGFMFYESSSATPDPLSPQLGGQVEEFVTVEGVVSRYREKNGNIFIAVRGEAEVEVPLFYGTALQLDAIPAPGDWVEVRGMLAETEDKYLRPYWPAYQIVIESPSHLQILGQAPHDRLGVAMDASLWNAGMLYHACGTVGAPHEGAITIAGAPIELDIVPRVGDSVTATVLLVEIDGALASRVLDIEIDASEPVPPSCASTLGAAYHVAGCVSDVRAYYKGVRIELSGGQDALPLYCPDIVDAFVGDRIDARGVLRTYYGEDVLYVSTCDDMAVTVSGTYEKPDSIIKGERYVLYCTVTQVEYKGSHPIYTLETELGPMYAHLYAKERDNLQRRDKSDLYLQEGAACHLYMEITSVEGTPTGKILDYTT